MMVVRTQDLVIDALAVARITRLITEDTFPPIANARNAFWKKFPPPGTASVKPQGSALGELISCPWCTSPYVAVGVLAARRFAPQLWDPLAKVLAASQVAGVIASTV